MYVGDKLAEGTATECRRGANEIRALLDSVFVRDSHFLLLLGGPSPDARGGFPLSRVLFSMGRELSGRVAARSDACPRSPLRGTRAATRLPLMLRFLPLIVRADVTVLFSYRMERPFPVGFRMHGIELRAFTRVWFPSR